VVVNTTPAERREVVRLTVWDRDPPGTPVPFHGKQFAACDDRGRPIGVQVMGKGAEWGHQNQTLAVPVTVPALGYTTLTLSESFDPPTAPRGAWVAQRKHYCWYAQAERACIGLENDLVSVAFDRQTGNLVSFLDKKSGVEHIAAGAGGMGFEFSVERPHGMSSWLIENSGPPERTILRRVEHAADGPLTAEILMEYGIRESTIKARYELQAGEPALRISLEIDWFERGGPTTGVPNLRLAVPTAFKDVTARYEIPFGALDRQTRPDQEVPALRWAKMSGRTGKRRAALVLFNDCKHGHAVEGATLRLNLVRSAYDPDYLSDVDRHLVRLALCPAAAAISDASLSAQAAAHEQPLLAIGTDVHQGRLPATQNLLKVRGTNVAVSGIKWAESGAGFIVRLANMSTAPAVAKLACARELGQVQSAQPVDLMERPAGPAVRAKGGVASVRLEPHGLGSWLVRT